MRGRLWFGALIVAMATIAPGLMPEAAARPEGTLTVDQILGTQGEMLADDAREAIRGDARPERDPLQVLAELRALRDSGMISDAEFEIRKSAIWPDI
jgi:hypothetical protein